MKTIEIKKATMIPAGNYRVSIGTYSTGDVAIFSNHTGEVCKFKDIRKGGKLAKIKRMFKGSICSTDSFFFSFMTEERTHKLIQLLKA